MPTVSRLVVAVASACYGLTMTMTDPDPQEARVSMSLIVSSGRNLTRGDAITVSGKTKCGRPLLAQRVLFGSADRWRIDRIRIAQRDIAWTMDLEFCLPAGPVGSPDGPAGKSVLKLDGEPIVRPGDEVEIEATYCGPDADRDDSSGWPFLAGLLLIDPARVN